MKNKGGFQMASQIFNTRATVRGYKVKAVNVHLGKNCEERKKS